MPNDAGSETDWVHVAFEQGEEARRTGKPESDNPYARDPEWQQYRAWAAGWRQAGKDIPSAVGDQPSSTTGPDTRGAA